MKREDSTWLDGTRLLGQRRRVDLEFKLQNLKSGFISQAKLEAESGEREHMG